MSAFAAAKCSVEPVLAMSETTKRRGFSWSGDYYASIADHMHALGVIAANYNSLELAFFFIFTDYLGHTNETQLAFAEFRNNYRQDVLSLVVQRYEPDAAVRDAVEYFVKSFDICAANRNTLMHSRVWDINNATTALRIPKGSRRTPLTQVSAEIPLARLKTIADEMFALEDFGWELSWFLLSRGGGIAAEHPRARQSLPERPPLPERLILPPHTTPRDGGDQPTA